MTTTDSHLRASRITHKRAEQRRRHGLAGSIVGSIVAAHLNECIDSGWTRLQIAAETGISDRAIRYILGGQKKVQRDNALRLLAVQPLIGARQPTTGSIRRVRALARAGYPILWTAERIGCSNRYIYEVLNGTIVTVERALVDRLAALYRRHEATPGPSEPARIVAKAKGWPGPEVWDHDTIDDPQAQPDYGRELSFIERAALRREEIIHFAWHGDTPEQILTRLNGEVSISTVRQIVAEWRTGEKRNRAKEAAA